MCVFPSQRSSFHDSCQTESKAKQKICDRAMAECMDEETVHTPLQLELTCSVCRGIFNNPMMLPCTHSFCRDCLQKSIQFTGNICPLCRERFSEGQAISNRALSDVCQTFVRYPHQGMIQNLESEAGCTLHLKPLLLYCEKDEQPLCVDCVALHNTHKLWPLTQAVPLCKVNMSLRILWFTLPLIIK